MDYFLHNMIYFPPYYCLFVALYYQCTQLQRIVSFPSFLQVTWADLAFLDVGAGLLNLYPSCLDKTPLLKALNERVNALPRIKEYIETRPVRDV